MSTDPIPVQPPEDIRAARPYLLARSPLKTFVRRVLSIAVLVAIDLSGLVIGLYAVIPILKSVSFLPELLYVQKYSHATVDSARTDLRIQYVELPLLVKMPLIWGIYFTEGVALGFPVQQRGLAPSLAQITSPDVSIVIGGGYNLTKKLAIEFRYDSGLRRVSTVPDALVQRERAYMAIGKLHF